MSLTSEERYALQSSLRNLEQVFTSNLLGARPDGREHLVFHATFTHMLIDLNHLLRKADKLGHRVAFRDDVQPIRVLTKRGKERTVEDVTELVGHMRNAVCHPESPLRIIYPVTIHFEFNVVQGRAHLATFEDFEIKSDYYDDIAVFYGPFRLYIYRHAQRAYRMARSALKPLIDPEPDRLRREIRPRPCLRVIK